VNAGLGAQFCCELAFGVLLALAFVPKAPVGRLFYRVMGTTACALLLAGAALRWRVSPTWGDALLWCALASALCLPFYSGALRGRAFALGLSLALGASAAAVVLAVAEAPRAGGGLALALGSASALATGAVAGAVAVAMVLGHWYLTVPNLALAHLARLNRVCTWSMGASLLLLAASCALLVQRAPAALNAFGAFFLTTRIAVGLLMPLLFAAMTASSIRHGNTRSATGILYASTVLVLIGTAVSISLQGSYGLPL